MGEARGGQIVWAVVLVLGSLFVLLLNFDLLRQWQPLADTILAGALALGGVGFLISFAMVTAAWWRLIPGWTLLALAAMVLLGAYSQAGGPLIAATLFWGLALAFVHIWLLKRSENWWAILPGGFLAVLGGVIALSAWQVNVETLGAALFDGLGLVFLLVYALGGPLRHWWALIPGSILVLFGLFVLTSNAGQNLEATRWWPVLTLLIGVYIAWRALRPRPQPKIEISTAPAAPPARQVLGDYSQPAPGASVQVMADPDKP